MRSPARHIIRLLAIALVVAVALALRLRAVERLPQDYDEPVYFRAGQHYAQAFRSGDWNELLSYSYNLEHPPLVKLAYGLVLAQLPPLSEIPEQPTDPPPAQPYPLPEPHFTATRQLSAAFGTLEVLALALLDPLAGLFLAVHTFTIKYTSQVYLEALPALTSLAAVLAYHKARGKWNGWLVASAVFLGLTAAAKYLYAVAGVAIVVHWLWMSQEREQVPNSRHREGAKRPKQSPVAGRGDCFAALRAARNDRLTDKLNGHEAQNARVWLHRLASVAGWGALALAVFLAADPFLWPDPLGRLRESVLFNASYSQSAHVQEAGLPIWQPLVWLWMSVPWHPDVFAVSLDALIALLAVLGLPALWRERSVFVVWLGVGLVFLFLWPTKWPQYILVLTAPLSLLAARGFREWVWRPLVSWLRRRRAARASRTAPAARPMPSLRRLRPALPWLLPGVIVLLLIAVYPLVFQVAMALTDFSVASIRDGIQGGVWREVWRGLTGQVRAQPLVYPRPVSPQVHYTGPALLLALLSALQGAVVVFDVLWTVLSVGLQLALGLGAALLLQQRHVRLKGLWRAIFILPWAVPEFVGAVVWLRMFEPRFGWITELPYPPWNTIPQWLSDPSLALPLLLIAATWCGFPMLMLAATAGLRMIPGEVHDAAAMDGADGWARFRFVTWPLLQPLLLPAMILRAIFAFNQFYIFYVIQPPYPVATLATVSFYVFGVRGEYAVSAAINLLTVALLMILIAWFLRRSRAAGGEGDDA